jgi:16S rRNA processing protein RimM
VIPRGVGHDVHPTPALDDAPAFPDDAVEVGRVLGAWGVKGGIKVKPFAADPQALFSSKRWFLRPGESSRPGPPAGLPPLLRIRQAREQGDAIVATCAEIEDRDAAERLKGARVYVARSSFPTAAEDEYYWVDLIGLAVRNRAGLSLGVISGLLETGPHCVLCIEPPGEGAGELMIPFVAAYVDRVDLAGRMVHVDWQTDY